MRNRDAPEGRTDRRVGNRSCSIRACLPRDSTSPRSALRGHGYGVPAAIPSLPIRFDVCVQPTEHQRVWADFGQGFDYGKRTFWFPVYSGTKARVAINPGANRFGGTMRILGTIGAKRAHEYQNKTFVGTGRSIFGPPSPTRAASLVT